MASTELVRSLLNDARTFGAVLIEKKKLLWLLGWGQDRGGAWTDLLTHWSDIGEETSTLLSVQIGDKVVLAKAETNKLPVMVRVADDWAQ